VYNGNTISAPFRTPSAGGLSPEEQLCRRNCVRGQRNDFWGKSSMASAGSGIGPYDQDPPIRAGRGDATETGKCPERKKKSTFIFASKKDSPRTLTASLDLASDALGGFCQSSGESGNQGSNEPDWKTDSPSAVWQLHKELAQNHRGAHQLCIPFLFYQKQKPARR
jgi:hypothetical protein